MSDDGLAGLLGRRLRESGQGPEASVTVAELHRILLPYGLCRDELGYATKAEYDLAVLGLLREERRVKVVEGRLATAVERELDTPEPGLAFLRDFAASELRLRFVDARENEPAPEPPPAEASPEEPDPEEPDPGGAVSAGPEVAPGDPGTAEGEAPEASEPGAGREESSSTARWLETLEGEGGRSSPAADAPGDGSRNGGNGTPADGGPRVAASAGEVADGPAAGPDAGEETTHCWRCRTTLPDRADLAFCPYCGTDQRAARCEKCGEMLEESWTFCPRCGAEVQDA